MDLSRPLPVTSQGIQDYVDGLDEVRYHLFSVIIYDRTTATGTER